MTARLLCAMMIALAAYPAVAQDSTATGSTSQAARFVPGARIRVPMTSGVRQSGRFVSLTDTSLMVRSNVPGFDGLFAYNARIDRRLVTGLEISSAGQHRGRAMALGVLVGGVVGAVVGATRVNNPCT